MEAKLAKVEQPEVLNGQLASYSRRLRRDPAINGAVHSGEDNIIWIPKPRNNIHSYPSKYGGLEWEAAFGQAEQAINPPTATKINSGQPETAPQVLTPAQQVAKQLQNRYVMGEEYSDIPVEKIDVSSLDPGQRALWAKLLGTYQTDVTLRRRFLEQTIEDRLRKDDQAREKGDEKSTLKADLAPRKNPQGIELTLQQRAQELFSPSLVNLHSFLRDTPYRVRDITPIEEYNEGMESRYQLVRIEKTGVARREQTVLTAPPAVSARADESDRVESRTRKRLTLARDKFEHSLTRVDDAYIDKEYRRMEKAVGQREDAPRTEAVSFIPPGQEPSNDLEFEEHRLLEREYGDLTAPESTSNGFSLAIGNTNGHEAAGKVLPVIQGHDEQVPVPQIDPAPDLSEKIIPRETVNLEDEFLRIVHPGETVSSANDQLAADKRRDNLQPAEPYQNNIYELLKSEELQGISDDQENFICALWDSIATGRIEAKQLIEEVFGEGLDFDQGMLTLSMLHSTIEGKLQSLGLEVYNPISKQPAKVGHDAEYLLCRTDGSQIIIPCLNGTEKSSEETSLTIPAVDLPGLPEPEVSAGEDFIRGKIPKVPSEEVTPPDLSELKAALDTIGSERRKNALRLRFVEIMSYQEIADALHISLGSVKLLIYRGKIALNNTYSSNKVEEMLAPYHEYVEARKEQATRRQRREQQALASESQKKALVKKIYGTEEGEIYTSAEVRQMLGITSGQSLRFFILHHTRKGTLKLSTAHYIGNQRVYSKPDLEALRLEYGNK
jgi:hypothetical protein